MDNYYKFCEARVVHFPRQNAFMDRLFFVSRGSQVITATLYIMIGLGQTLAHQVCYSVKSLALSKERVLKCFADPDSHERLVEL